LDSAGTLHYPLSRSPVFVQHGDEFRLDRGDSFEGDLLFETPRDRDSVRLLYDRYQD
jgi:hypothetical protein